MRLHRIFAALLVPIALCLAGGTVTIDTELTPGPIGQSAISVTASWSGPEGGSNYRWNVTGKGVSNVSGSGQSCTFDLNYENPGANTIEVTCTVYWEKLAPDGKTSGDLPVSASGVHKVVKVTQFEPAGNGIYCTGDQIADSDFTLALNLNEFKPRYLPVNHEGTGSGGTYTAKVSWDAEGLDEHTTTYEVLPLSGIYWEPLPSPVTINDTRTDIVEEVYHLAGVRYEYHYDYVATGTGTWNLRKEHGFSACYSTLSTSEATGLSATLSLEATFKQWISLGGSVSWSSQDTLTLGLPAEENLKLAQRAYRQDLTVNVKQFLKRLESYEKSPSGGWRWIGSTSFNRLEGQGDGTGTAMPTTIRGEQCCKS